MLEEKFRIHLETQLDQLFPNLIGAAPDYQEDKQMWKYDHYFDFHYGFKVGMMLGTAMMMFESYYKRPARSSEIQDAVQLIKNRASKMRKDIQDSL